MMFHPFITVMSKDKKQARKLVPTLCVIVCDFKYSQLFENGNAGEPE